MKSRIKAIRAAENLTQEEFARRLSITRNYVAQIEIGAKEPGERTIRDICREFGVNETWLRTGVGQMRAPPDRAQELGALTARLLTESPESFRSALVTTLLRFDPDGPEWAALEKIYEAVKAEMEKAAGKF